MLVLFKDGKLEFLPVYRYEGAALVGQPTAYVMRANQMVWVRPGVSVDFIED